MLSFHWMDHVWGHDGVDPAEDGHMAQLPDYLLAFRAVTGIDPAGWQAWRNESLTAVSGIREHRQAVALRDFFIDRMGMAADLNEPVTENGTWGVVAVPIPPFQR